MATPGDVRKAIFDDPYEEEDDNDDMLVGNVFTMQQCKKIEDQIILKEPNNLLFIVKPDESTTKEEKLVEIKELMKKDPNELVTFEKDMIIMQTFNFIEFVTKDDEEIEVFLVEFFFFSFYVSLLVFLFKS